MQIMLDFDSVVRFRSKVTNENCLNRNLKLKVRIEKTFFIQKYANLILVNVYLLVNNTGVKVILRDR